MANQQSNGGVTYDPKTGKITGGDNDPNSYFSNYTDVNGNPIPQWMIDQSLQNGTSHQSWFTWGADTGNGFTAPGSTGQDNSTAVSNLIGIPGLPPDVADQVMNIFNQYPNDPQQAAQLALQYIRGTDWYATNYAGIQDGINSGVINNEADYRAYMNQANQMYQQYYGRAITLDDMKQLMSQGIDLSLLSKQLDAGAKLNATSQANPKLAALFNQDELQQIANNEAGLGSEQGQYLQGLYQYASQVAPIYAQYGAKIDRAQLEKNFTNGVPVETITRQFAGSAFIGANKNDIQTVTGVGANTGKLTAQQLKAYGNEQAGLDTPLGARIQAIVDHATRTFQGLFNGQVATPGLTVGPAGRVQASTLGNRNPDVGA